MISIHAPLAGCDATAVGTITDEREFQSTHPLRGATGVLNTFSDEVGFQSTHPLRGATYRSHGRNRDVYFNPRTPCGVRPADGAEIPAIQRFQSTHPLRGATYRTGAAGRTERISIHAPLAGCDRRSWKTAAACHDFNPRTPCGVRRGCVVVLTLDVISIHAPLAGCDLYRHPAQRAAGISIHAPLAGCDKTRPGRLRSC